MSARLSLPNNEVEKAKETVEEYYRLLKKYGALSWRIEKIADELNAEKISASHFREKVRELIDKHIKI